MIKIATSAIWALILGVSTFRLFNFQTLKFENTGLAVVYLTALVAAAFFLVKTKKHKEETGD